MNSANSLVPFSTTAIPWSWWQPTGYLYNQDGKLTGFIVQFEQETDDDE